MQLHHLQHRFCRLCVMLCPPLCPDVRASSLHPHLHVDLLESRDQVSDLPEGEAAHPGRRPDARQQHPLLVCLLELLLDEAHLTGRGGGGHQNPAGGTDFTLKELYVTFES